jgi:hypothetical protein
VFGIWQAADADWAMNRARAEAEKYAAEAGFELVDYITACEVYEPKDGAEVWSLMRDSWLPPKDYVDRFIRRGDPHAVPYDEWPVTSAARAFSNDAWRESSGTGGRAEPWDLGDRGMAMAASQCHAREEELRRLSANTGP